MTYWKRLKPDECHNHPLIDIKGFSYLPAIGIQLVGAVQEALVLPTGHHRLWQLSQVQLEQRCHRVDVCVTAEQSGSHWHRKRGNSSSPRMSGSANASERQRGLIYAPRVGLLASLMVFAEQSTSERSTSERWDVVKAAGQGKVGWEEHIAIPATYLSISVSVWVCMRVNSSFRYFPKICRLQCRADCARCLSSDRSHEALFNWWRRPAMASSAMRPKRGHCYCTSVQLLQFALLKNKPMMNRSSFLSLGLTGGKRWVIFIFFLPRHWVEPLLLTWHRCNEAKFKLIVI